MTGTSSLRKGALVSVADGRAQTSIPSQDNPDTLRRTLQPQQVGGQQNDRSRMVHYAGAPVKTIAGMNRMTPAYAVFACNEPTFGA